MLSVHVRERADKTWLWSVWWGPPGRLSATSGCQLQDVGPRAAASAHRTGNGEAYKRGSFLPSRATCTSRVVAAIWRRASPWWWGWKRRLFQEEQREKARLKDEQEANYLQLLEYAGQSVINNRQPFTCSICYDDVAIGEGITLQECLHEFCRYDYINIVLRSGVTWSLLPVWRRTGKYGSKLWCAVRCNRSRLCFVSNFYKKT